jgi:hypothetical protein
VIGLELATRFPGRVRSAVLGGETPFVSEEAVVRWRGLAERLETQSIAAVAAQLCEQQRLVVGGTELPDDLEEGAHASALLQAMAGWEINDRGKITVRQQTAIFEGQREEESQGARRAQEVIPSAELISVPGVSTAQGVMEREALLEGVVAFFKAARRAPERGAETPAREQDAREAPRDEQEAKSPAEAPPAGEAGASESPATADEPSDATEAPATSTDEPREPAETAPNGAEPDGDSVPGGETPAGEEGDDSQHPKMERSQPDGAADASPQEAEEPGDAEQETGEEEP